MVDFVKSHAVPIIGILTILVLLFFILFVVWVVKDNTCNSNLAAANNQLTQTQSSLSSANTTITTYQHGIHSIAHIISPNYPLFYLIAQRVYNKGPFTNTANFPPVLTYSMILGDPVANFIMQALPIKNDDLGENLTRGLVAGFFTNASIWAPVNCSTTYTDDRIPFSLMPNLNTILTPSPSTCITNGQTSDSITGCMPWVPDYITGFSFSNQCANPTHG